MSNRLSRLVLAGSLIVIAGFAAQKDHNDAFTAGDPTETRIAQQVRHQLVMLPYYGVLTISRLSWTAARLRCWAR
jgi:hypothetical protein